jgi:hypothetical protein
MLRSALINKGILSRTGRTTNHATGNACFLISNHKALECGVLAIGRSFLAAVTASK